MTVLLAAATVQTGELLWLAVAIVGAVSSFIAIPMFLFFMKDRRKGLLRQEVEDERRRREQLELRASELTKERDTLRSSLADERKRPNVDSLAALLSEVAVELRHVVGGNVQILEKLATMNGGLAHAAEALAATNETARAQTEAVKFLASQVVTHDPELVNPKPTT